MWGVQCPSLYECLHGSSHWTYVFILPLYSQSLSIFPVHNLLLRFFFCLTCAILYFWQSLFSFRFVLLSYYILFSYSFSYLFSLYICVLQPNYLFLFFTSLFYFYLTKDLSWSLLLALYFALFSFKLNSLFLSRSNFPVVLFKIHLVSQTQGYRYRGWNSIQ